MAQQRHFCRDCQREWLFARQWDGETCPACGSRAIDVVVYTPAFPGADIPRTPETVLTAAAPAEPVVRPQVNQTLAMSSPEFA